MRRTIQIHLNRAVAKRLGFPAGKPTLAGAKETPQRQKNVWEWDSRVVAEVFKRSEDGDGYVLRLFDASGEGAEGVAVRCAGREAALSFAPQEIQTLFLPDDPAQPVRERAIHELK